MTRAIAKGLKNHWTVKYGKMVPKKQFKTVDEVLNYMSEHNINKDVYSPYVCKDCGMWHIGHNSNYKKNNIK